MWATLKIFQINLQILTSTEPPEKEAVVDAYVPFMQCTDRTVCDITTLIQHEMRYSCDNMFTIPSLCVQYLFQKIFLHFP